jgi:hypothetical protein
MSHNLVPNSRIIGEKLIGKDLKGSSHGTIKVLYWYLLGGTEEIHNTLSQDNQCPSRIQTKHLLNTNLEHYCCTNLLSAFNVFS